MFGIGVPEAAVIIVIGLLVVGPERLPVMIRDAVRWVRDLKRVVDDARRDLTDQLGPELRDLGIEDLRELDPRTYVRRNVLDGLDDEIARPEAGPPGHAGASSDRQRRTTGRAARLRPRHDLAAPRRREPERPPGQPPAARRAPRRPRRAPAPRASSGRSRPPAPRRRRWPADRGRAGRAQHRHVDTEPAAERRGDPLSAAAAEDLEPVLGAAVRAGQVGHVLDDARRRAGASSRPSCRRARPPRRRPPAAWSRRRSRRRAGAARARSRCRRCPAAGRAGGRRGRPSRRRRASAPAPGRASGRARRPPGRAGA